MEPGGLQTFIDDVGRVVTGTDDEHEITKRVAKRLSDLLAGGYRLPLEVTRPSPVHHGDLPALHRASFRWQPTTSLRSCTWSTRSSLRHRAGSAIDVPDQRRQGEIG